MCVTLVKYLNYVAINCHDKVDVYFRPNKHFAYGQSRPKSAPAFRPKYCFLDKKVLRFFGHFDEHIANVFGKNVEHVVRNVQILYFLEDDTISIVEPRIKVGLD